MGNLMLFTLISAFSFTVYANSLFQQMIEKDIGIKSKESTVYIDGIEYRKVEIENNTYYLSFKGRNSDKPSLFCQSPNGGTSENLIEGSVNIKKRKRLYFKLLKEQCVPQKGQVQTSVELAPELGIFLPESKSDAIKNKKVGLNPLQPKRLNFSGEW